MRLPGNAHVVAGRVTVAVTLLCLGVIISKLAHCHRLNTEALAMDTHLLRYPSAISGLQCTHRQLHSMHAWHVRLC